MSYIHVYHSKSNIHGVGVFINEDIKKEQIIGVSHAEFEGVWYMTTHGYYNHSENPNCIIKETVCKHNILTLIVADKDIKKDEELTVDYRKQPFLEQPKDGWVK